MTTKTFKQLAEKLGLKPAQAHPIEYWEELDMRLVEDVPYVPGKLYTYKDVEPVPEEEDDDWGVEGCTDPDCTICRGHR